MRSSSLPIFPGSIRKNDAVFLFGAAQKKPFVKIYEQDTTEIVCGPSCRQEKEVNVKQCSADAVPVVERRGGGGTVVLSKGMVISIVVGERSTGLSATDYFNTLHDQIIKQLSPYCPIEIERCGISDLACNGRKILGSSLYMGTRPYFYYYQSSLLVNPDVSLFEKYLFYPPREPEYRQHREHSAFCTTLAEQGCSLKCAEVVKLFSEGLQSYLVSR